MTLDPAAQLIDGIHQAQDGLLDCWGVLETIPGYPLDDSLAANLRRLAAELASAREIITEAALETYTPDGSEVIVGQMLRQRQELRALRDQLAAAQEREQRVQWLTEPYLGQAEGYQHYAVALTDGVHLAVLVDDLRAALAGEGA